MATNEVFRPANTINVVCSNPTTPASGDPVRFGDVIGVALTDEDADGLTTIDLGPSVYDLSVKGINDSGNSAVAAGNSLFYVDADTPKLSKKATGTFAGIAMETVGSGSTATIQVWLAGSPGAGTLGTGTVSATNLATGAVTAVKLSSTLKTGYIPLNLAGWREITTNDIPATAADAGALSSNTTPFFARVNAATDKKLRIGWAASNSDAITFDFAYPPDIDAASDVTICILASMAGATDTPTVAVNFFEGVGDTNAGGNTAAITGTTVTKYTRAIAAADVSAYGGAAGAASVEIVPGTHTTDALYIYGAWIEYTRA